MRAKIRNSGLVITDFGSIRGSGGYSHCKPISSSLRWGETWGNGACEGTQAVLAIFGKFPVGNLRVVRA